MSNGSEDIVLAIQEEELGNFAMDLLNTSDLIADVFNNIDAKMAELGTYYEAPEYKSLMNVYTEFKKNYAVVKNNVISYSDDLIAVVNKVQAGDKKLALLIEDLTKDTLRKAKEIENT